MARGDYPNLTAILTQNRLDPTRLQPGKEVVVFELRRGIAKIISQGRFVGIENGDIILRNLPEDEFQRVGLAVLLESRVVDDEPPRRHSLTGRFVADRAAYVAWNERKGLR